MFQANITRKMLGKRESPEFSNLKFNKTNRPADCCAKTSRYENKSSFDVRKAHSDMLILAAGPSAGNSCLCMP